MIALWILLAAVGAVGAYKVYDVLRFLKALLTNFEVKRVPGEPKKRRKNADEDECEDCGGPCDEYGDCEDVDCLDGFYDDMDADSGPYAKAK